jgi:hypothetical protein
LFLLASEGYFVRGRCGSSNLCAYCLIQEVHVIRRMLSLQALDGPAPEILAVLGTGDATLDPAPFYDGRRLVMRALKKEVGPEVGYACLSEFTTGKSAYSGGLRRPHWNMLLRGIGLDDIDQVRELVVRKWCDNAPNTDPAAQYVEPLRDTAALMRYLANHFSKRDQQPPQDGRWKHKQRFNCSRNYFAPMTRAEARQRAWWSLQHEREIAKAVDRGETDPMAAAELALEQLRATTWALHDAGSIAPTPEVMRLMHRASLNFDRWQALAAAVKPGAEAGPE